MYGICFGELSRSVPSPRWHVSLYRSIDPFLRENRILEVEISPYREREREGDLLYSF